HPGLSRDSAVWAPAFAGATASTLLRRGIPGVRSSRNRPRPYLRNRALQRDLARVGQDGGAGFRDCAGEIGERQVAVEGRFGEAVDDRMPVGKTAAVRIA